MFLGIHYLYFRLLRVLFFDSTSHSTPEGCTNSLSVHIQLLKCVRRFVVCVLTHSTQHWKQTQVLEIIICWIKIDEAEVI